MNGFFCVNEFDVGVNDSIFSGNEQQKVYIMSYSLFSAFAALQGNTMVLETWRLGMNEKYVIILILLLMLLT